MEAQKYAEAGQLLRGSCLNCDPRVNLLLAAALEGNGDSLGAEQTLQKAHSIWPADNSTTISLARQYLLAHQYEIAATTLHEFHASANTPSQELELGVEVYLATHQLEAAYHLADLNYASYPSAASITLLANILQLEGRSQNVVSLMRGVATQYATEPGFLVTLAESEYDLGMFPEAHEHLEHAVALKPGFPQAHYLLGNTLVKQSELPEAIAEYRLAIKLAPEKPRSYYQLALALVQSNDEAGAKQTLTQALAADNHYAPAYCEMGRLLLKENRAGEAVEALKEAIQNNPDLEDAYFLLVRAYSRIGQKEQSDATLARYLAVREANRKKPPVKADAPLRASPQ